MHDIWQNGQLSEPAAQACRVNGIKPSELQNKPLDFFLEKGVSDE
jgi:hypothetical protein